MSNLLINEPPLQVLPTLARLVGLNESIFLQQLHWLLGKIGKERDGRKWVYRTYEEWRRDFPFWSERTIMRVVTNLEARKLLATTDKYNKVNSDRTLWYSIDYGGLDTLSGPSCQSVTLESDRLSPSIETDNLSLSNHRRNKKERDHQPSSFSEKDEKSDRKPRARNPLFDAICRVCDLDPDHLPPDTKGSAVGKVMKGLKAANWQAEDVERYHAWRTAKALGPLKSIHWLVDEMAKREWRASPAGAATSTVSDWIE